MSKQKNRNTKNVMDDVINDIASATNDAIDEAQEEIAEAEATLDEAAATGPRPDTIVVKFDDELDAARAVRVVNKALRKRSETIYQGAVVTRKSADDFQVEDMHDMGLADLVSGGLGIGFDLGRDGAKLAWATAAAGVGLIRSSVRLLRLTALSAAGLAGSTWTIPKRRHLQDFAAAEEIETSTADLEPGETAVVIVADHDTASQLATDLVRSGGELT